MTEILWNLVLSPIIFFVLVGLIRIVWAGPGPTVRPTPAPRPPRPEPTPFEEAVFAATIPVGWPTKDWRRDYDSDPDLPF